MNVLAVALGGIYAVSVVMWLHAPMVKVLILTVPAVLLVLGCAWLLNKLRLKLRT